MVISLLLLLLSLFGSQNKQLKKTNIIYVAYFLCVRVTVSKLSASL